MSEPTKLNTALFAPCGMNCMVCYKHLGKRPCPGCLSEKQNKPEHCRTCKIKECTQAKGIGHCFACGDFPCGQMKALDKSYRTRYGVCLVEFSRIAAEQGIEALLSAHHKQYGCPDCGGIISLHDGDCSGCGKEFPLGRRRMQK
ncbi:DUF3795 domain-containing protein [Oscillospiraceae bacterium MB08-C2-2]|nr:DUF3795 domain-containing protein [Oscillospiraceae bacterium MB08-C2-2]